MNRATGIALLLVAAALTFVFTARRASKPSASSTSQNVSGSVPGSATTNLQSTQKEAFNTGNEASDRLLALSFEDQATALGGAVGEGCKGDLAFYMGIERKTREAFWSVRCADGNSWVVEIAPNVKGTTHVLECSVLQALHGGTCFQKFKGQ